MGGRRRWAAVVTLLVALSSMAAGAGAQAQAPEAVSVTVDVLAVPSERTLLGVSFPTPTHGYAVGDQGVILATTDGGVTWREQSSGIAAIDPTCDVGANGEKIESDCTNVLRDVQFVDASTGWAVGSDGIVLHTADGGTSWRRQQLPPLDSISGLGPGPGGTDLRAPHWDDLTSVSFPDARSGVVVGPGGTILSTADGGTTWQWRGDRRFGGLNAVAFADRQHGQAVGLMVTGLSQYVTVATADGGTTWEMRQPPPRNRSANASFLGVSFLDAQRGYIAGDSGRILATADGGQTWFEQRGDTTETFRDIDFGDDRRGIAAGATNFSGDSRASLVATADGGQTWTTRLLDGLTVWAVDFATPTTAYAVGCTRQTEVIRNRGNGEEKVYPCSQSFVARITFPADTGGGGAGTDSRRPEGAAAGDDLG
ncbi:MAG TPA: YCF48-related protein, partial [Acidimicrobiales bacterium]